MMECLMLCGFIFFKDVLDCDLISEFLVCA